MLGETRERRAVVTGIGVISPAGIGKTAFWETISAGRSCVSEIDRFDTGCLRVKIGAQIKGFNPAAWLGMEVDEHNHLVELYALCAAKLALDDSGICLSETDPERFGLTIGTSAGGMEVTTGRLLRRLDASLGANVGGCDLHDVAAVMPGNLAASVAQNLQLNAGCVGISTGCTASSDAIGFGYEYIRDGLADLMLVGGSEAPIEPITIQAFDAIGTLSHRKDPETASRPFDKGRDGFVIGEGAGMLLLEEEQRARERGAHIYAEVAAYQTACDAYHLTSSDPAMIAARRVIQSALREAEIEPEQVDYITAHGSSTQMNDARETAIIKSVFGERAYQIPITGLKSMIGHTSGAAGSLQAVGALLAMANNFLPPTINYETPDPVCDLDYVPNVGRRATVKVTLQNTYAYAGKNVAILYRRSEGMGRNGHC